MVFRMKLANERLSEQNLNQRKKNMFCSEMKGGIKTTTATVSTKMLNEEEKEKKKRAHIHLLAGCKLHARQN